MGNKRERSRQKWEQEVRSRQQSVTPADYPESLHYARVNGLPKIVSQGRFWLGIVVMAMSVSVFRSAIPAGVAVAAVAGVAGVVIGLCLTITAMRLNDKR
jgi:hypothetical protein